MKITIKERTGVTKSEVLKLRREGLVPAVIYHRGKEGEIIAINNTEFKSHLRHVIPGRLSTTAFTLIDANGKERRAILKEIQYHPTSYDVLHLDFEELHSDTPVKVKVPIECVGAAECPGVKLGGVLRQPIRYLRVRCLPKDIPSVFQLDVITMVDRDVRRLSDLVIPQTVTPLAKMHDVAAVIVKR